jgi:hypothetical protein
MLTQGFILEKEAEKRTYVYEIGVRKPWVASALQRNEELHLQAS